VAQTLFEACFNILSKIGNEISAIKTEYQGACEFTDARFFEVFKNKTLYITDPRGDGAGISQNASVLSPNLKIDLSDKAWFVFNDNYGTSKVFQKRHLQMIINIMLGVSLFSIKQNGKRNM